LGYWVLGNIHRYWVVLLLGDISCCSDTQYNTNQRAVSTVHLPVNDYLVLLLTCTLADAIVCLDTMLICYCLKCLLNTIIVIIIEFWDFSWSLLCSTQVSVLILGIGITRGQYYWLLDIGCLSWCRSNPTLDATDQTMIYYLCHVVKTLCERKCERPAALGSSRVECEPDGSFKPMQCTRTQSECWCVDGLGREVPNTRTPVYLAKHKPNCGMLSHT